MRYANIYIYIFVLHRGFFQQPRGRVAPRLACVRGETLQQTAGVTFSSIISKYLQHADAAGYKPAPQLAPQLGRQIALSLKHFTHTIRHRVSLKL